MNKFYYLSTCSTCKRITLTGSYEALINKRARMFKERGINASQLKEEDFKKLLYDHYTFMKRPILLLDKVLFVGNSKQTVANAKLYLMKRI